jgi:hypothetical protein
MRNSAKTPQFWIICFVITVNASWLQAQSFDTLVLKNVEKKYVTGSLISMQKDYIVYFRQSLPNGPEFRMSKQNVRWIITKDNEIIEVSEKFNSEYKIIDEVDSSRVKTVTESVQPTSSSASNSNSQEYYTNPVTRTNISPQEDISREKKNETTSFSSQSSGDLYVLGLRDASMYYKGYRGAGTGTLLVGLLSPLVGLIPAIVCSSTQPQEINLSYPKADLMKNSQYYNGYTYKAKKIKQGKVWANWGIAFGVNLVAILLLTSGQ